MKQNANTKKARTPTIKQIDLAFILTAVSIAVAAWLAIMHVAERAY